MPNTLAHIACNGFISKPFFKNSDLIWILTGCILPDVPWINQRIAGFLFSDLNGYDLKVFSIAQATLFFCLILSAAFSSLSYNYRRVFTILSLGALLHLFLDSLQTKWANGIHLFAPFNWEYFNLNLFWPESTITYIFSSAGILFFLINFKNIKTSDPDIYLTKQRLKLFLPLILSYFVLPFAFLDQINEADVNYVSTLRNYKERKGKYVEMDRKKIYYNEITKSTWIDTYNGQSIELDGLDKLDYLRISIKGRFKENNLIEVFDYKGNWVHFRDGSSYIGISLIGFAWFLVIRKRFGDKLKQ